MQYQYNYSFLSEWMEANPKISINSILQAIGTKSNNSLRMWEQKQCAMPVIGILRFCNTFQVPISAFFCNTGEPCTTEVDIPETAQWEPEGGYTTDATKRQPGERKPLSPTDITRITSVVPHTTSTILCNKEDAVTDNSSPAVRESEIRTADVVALQRQHAANEAELLKQQQRMLDIIAKQQEQIEDLTKLLQEKENRRSLGYGMVAEP